MGQTRKIRKPTIKEEKPPETPWWWDRFLIEGDRLFAYLTSKYDDLFTDSGSRIKHFYLRDDAVHDIGTEKIREQYNKELEQELLHWIQNEHASGRLFQKDLWRPVRDSYLLTYMYLGYRKTFQFKHYVFQLAFEADCDLDDCETCKAETNTETTDHFSLAYLGWYVEGKQTLEPYNRILLQEDQMLPEWYWNIK